MEDNSLTRTTNNREARISQENVPGILSDYLIISPRGKQQCKNKMETWHAKQKRRKLKKYEVWYMQSVFFSLLYISSTCEQSEKKKIAYEKENYTKERKERKKEWKHKTKQKYMALRKTVCACDRHREVELSMINTNINKSFFNPFLLFLLPSL